MNNTPATVLAAFEALLVTEKVEDQAYINAASGALIARLRHFNREASQSTKAARQHTAETRAIMENAHLDLQNLLYERRYLEKEIQKCEESDFSYQNIDLHSEEEFNQLAPNELKGAEDEHEHMKNRLLFEMSERTRLEERKKALVAEREKLVREKKETKSKLQSSTQEEAEFAKKAAALEGILAELTLTAFAQPAASSPSSTAPTEGRSLSSNGAASKPESTKP